MPREWAALRKPWVSTGTPRALKGTWATCTPSPGPGTEASRRLLTGPNVRAAAFPSAKNTPPSRKGGVSIRKEHIPSRKGGISMRKNGCALRMMHTC